MTAEVSRHEKATAFLEGRTQGRRSLKITTPEGVTLLFELADPGERATALAIDLFVWAVATVLVYLILGIAVVGAGLLHGEVGIAVGLSIMLFLGFVVRNLYFIHFELAWQGRTPGKRAMGIRVIDRRGGPLKPLAVIARNLTREIEVFMPLGILMSLGSGIGLWEKLALGVWMLLFSTLPLFNRERLRGGDMIAGTAVIALPKRILLADLADSGTKHAFLEKHLSTYGAFELQILEDLLRRPNAPDARQLRRDVTAKIRKKIGWEAKVADADIDRFLMDFYTAQRAHLERAQLYGKFRADKNDAPRSAGI
jgi:uncharacterized RDD family membrane protein YckC